MVKVINAQRSLAKQIIVRAASLASGDVKKAEKVDKDIAAHGESFIESVEFGELW